MRKPKKSKAVKLSRGSVQTEDNFKKLQEYIKKKEKDKTP
jgi:hypothetical protein